MNKTGSNSYIVHYCIAVASNYGYTGKYQPVGTLPCTFICELVKVCEFTMRSLRNYS